MVLKCLNYIYRLSIDLTFFTWSPFVWMKNWYQMRKDFTREKTSLIVAPPRGRLMPLLLNNLPLSICIITQMLYIYYSVQHVINKYGL